MYKGVANNQKRKASRANKLTNNIAMIVSARGNQLINLIMGVMVE